MITKKTNTDNTIINPVAYYAIIIFSSVLFVSLFIHFFTPKTALASTITAQNANVPMHRLYNPNSGEHFYTQSQAEISHLVSAGWKYEGNAWTAPRQSNTPVYRVYNANAGDHHYTVSSNERKTLISLGWKDEGIGWYSSDEKTIPIYRSYNPNATTGTHNYTASTNEYQTLNSYGWNNEGIAWYGINPNQTKHSMVHFNTMKYNYHAYLITPVLFTQEALNDKENGYGTAIVYFTTNNPYPLSPIDKNKTFNIANRYWEKDARLGTILVGKKNNEPTNAYDWVPVNNLLDNDNILELNDKEKEIIKQYDGFVEEITVPTKTITDQQNYSLNLSEIIQEYKYYEKGEYNVSPYSFNFAPNEITTNPNDYYNHKPFTTYEELTSRKLF